jgi:hypothetical protein
MTMSATETLDQAAAEELSARFHGCFRDQEVGELFTPDAFFDLNMPTWRFQIQGPDAFEAQLRKLFEGIDEVRMDVGRVVPTVDGFVAEHVETTIQGDDMLTARRMTRCEVVNGRINHVVVYCTGGWDEATRVRHAAEAPMLRS